MPSPGDARSVPTLKQKMRAKKLARFVPGKKRAKGRAVRRHGNIHIRARSTSCATLGQKTDIGAKASSHKTEKKFFLTFNFTHSILVPLLQGVKGTSPCRRKSRLKRAGYNKENIQTHIEIWQKGQFAQQGVKGSPRKKESRKQTQRLKRAKNKGKLSAAYWANKW